MQLILSIQTSKLQRYRVSASAQKRSRGTVQKDVKIRVGSTRGTAVRTRIFNFQDGAAKLEK